jgi:anti-sigma factor RsiW
MSADVEHLTCQEFVEVLTDYLDGALEPAERADVERHLVICRGCSNYTEQMRSTVGLLRRIADERPAEEQAGLLLTMFRTWQAGRSA